MQMVLDTLAAAALLFLLAVTQVGCAQMFTAKTTASYITPDGKQISYTSDKEHEGLDAKWISTDGNGVKTEVHIKTAKSGTPEAAMAALAQLYTRFMDMLERLEKAGAMSGS